MATKRSNPFIEDFVPQSKVHVGLKQFNNNEDRLKKVYEKTLELLFMGAKKSSNLDSISTQTIAAIYKKDGMKQLVIGKDGCLLNSEETQVQVKPTAVQQCSCGNTKTEVNCTYCERVLCIMCQHCCARCEKYHCSQCSLIGSEGSQICVSCYGIEKYLAVLILEPEKLKYFETMKCTNIWNWFIPGQKQHRIVKT